MNQKKSLFALLLSSTAKRGLACRTVDSAAVFTLLVRVKLEYDEKEKVYMWAAQRGADHNENEQLCTMSKVL